MIPRKRKASVILVLIIAIGLCASTPWAATGQEKDQAVEQKIVQADPAPTAAPSTSHTLDDLGRQIGHEIHQLEHEASSFFHRWINTGMLGSITWITWGSSLFFIFLVVLFERIVRIIIRSRIKKIPEEERTGSWTALLLEALCEPLSLFIWVYGIYAALSPLFVHFQRSDGTNLVLSTANTVANFGGTIAIIWFIYRLVHVVDVKLSEWVGAGQIKTEELLVRLVGKTLRIFVIVIGAIMLIQNFTGVEVGPLIASLGIGGIAVALAAKDSIANLFGSVMIVLDKPFEVGERIVSGSYDGIVEAVGYRSTRLRTLDGHLICIPNEKLINNAIENIGKRPYLKWATNLTLTYDTPRDKMERAVEILRELLDNHEGMHADYQPQVHFNAFNDWSLNVAIFAWYHPASWWDYQDWLERTCLEILQRFEDEGIEFAFPSQTLYLANDDKRQLKLRMLKGEEVGA